MSPVAPEFFRGKHLVVFGAGYVGAEVVRQAVARGLRVTALTRNADKARHLVTSGAATVIADLADDSWHAHPSLAAGADFALNCVSSGGGGLAGYRHSYLEGMRSIRTWAERAPVGAMVYTSSTSVYPQDGGVRVDESAPTEGAGEAGKVLLEAEACLLAGANRGFVLRLAGIYGPGRHHLLDQLREGDGPVAGRGDHSLNLIHRDDIAAAVWAALGAPAGVPGGIFNVADDGAAPKAEVIAWLAARLGRPVPSFTGEPAQGRRKVTPDRIIANDKLKRTLGWSPRYPTFREGYAALLG
ncbi:MAG: NAD-dependent epimerase/dehydratase family protein [Verrucomicrobia bacterium]|nr:NAD-dependent epimerase/dehydratase family protein [Verrucomicrobiota bacterium]